MHESWSGCKLDSMQSIPCTITRSWCRKARKQSSSTKLTNNCFREGISAAQLEAKSTGKRMARSVQDKLGVIYLKGLMFTSISFILICFVLFILFYINMQIEAAMSLSWALTPPFTPYRPPLRGNNTFSEELITVTDCECSLHQIWC